MVGHSEADVMMEEVTLFAVQWDHCGDKFPQSCQLLCWIHSCEERDEQSRSQMTGVSWGK
jgi:hypothetical protein